MCNKVQHDIIMGVGPGIRVHALRCIETHEVSTGLLMFLSLRAAVCSEAAKGCWRGLRYVGEGGVAGLREFGRVGWWFEGVWSPCCVLRWGCSTLTRVVVAGPRPDGLETVRGAGMTHMGVGLRHWMEDCGCVRCLGWWG